MMPVASTLLNDKSLNDHDMWLTACLLTRWWEQYNCSMGGFLESWDVGDPECKVCAAQPTLGIYNFDVFHIFSIYYIGGFRSDTKFGFCSLFEHTLLLVVCKNYSFLMTHEAMIFCCYVFCELSLSICRKHGWHYLLTCCAWCACFVRENSHC